MQDLIIERTNSTPYIDFRGETGCLQIVGESYPENVSKFYAPVLDWVRAYLEQAVQPTTVEFRVTYFNSSSSKVFMIFFDLLEQGVINGQDISVKWFCDEDNDIAIECGEEFKEELTRLPFTIEIASGQD